MAGGCGIRSPRLLPGMSVLRAIAAVCHSDMRRSHSYRLLLRECSLCRHRMKLSIYLEDGVATSAALEAFLLAQGLPYERVPLPTCRRKGADVVALLLDGPVQFPVLCTEHACATGLRDCLRLACSMLPESGLASASRVLAVPDDLLSGQCSRRMMFARSEAGFCSEMAALDKAIGALGNVATELAAQSLLVATSIDLHYLHLLSGGRFGSRTLPPLTSLRHALLNEAFHRIYLDSLRCARSWIFGVAQKSEPVAGVATRNCLITADNLRYVDQLLQ